MIIMCQCHFMFGKKCTMLLSDADNGGGYACGGAGSKWEISVPFSDFVYPPI